MSCIECGCEHGHHQPWCLEGGSLKLKNPTSFIFSEPPPPAGHWQISGNLHISVEKKPSVLNKFFAAYLLGWKWHD